MLRVFLSVIKIAVFEAFITRMTKFNIAWAFNVVRVLKRKKVGFLLNYRFDACLKLHSKISFTMD